MPKAKIIVLSIMAAIPSVAVADSTNPLATQTPEATIATSPAKPAAAVTKANTPDLQEQVTSSFQSAGFTDVKVMPDSFLVLAKDKSGNGVTIFISPGIRTEFTTANVSGRTDGRSSSDKSDMFTDIPSSDHLGSSMIGLDIYTDKNLDIGTIKDLSMDGSDLKAYIVGIGGFLGMGEHYVAVKPSAITVRFDADTKVLHATMNTTAEQLKAAPEYKYRGNF